MHTHICYRPFPPLHRFFLLIDCTFPLLGLYLSHLVHLIPYDMDL